MQRLKAWSCRLKERCDSAPKRVLLVTVVMALVWGLMMACQGAQGPINTCDWTLMSEVGRRLALGDTLYVQAIDQKGPLTYGVYALEWLICHNQLAAFVLSNVAVWLCLTISSRIAAIMVEEANRAWAHPFAQGLLAAVLFVPHTGCVELWLVPFGMAAALWVRRLSAGRQVPALCWVVVGLSAAFALWAKFTLCAQFVFLLCYAASRKETKGLGRAALIALVVCALASAAVLWWMVSAGSFDAMMQHYVHAATDGYAQRMSFVQHLLGGGASSTHVISFVLGAIFALWALVRCWMGAHRRLPLVFGGLLYLACCFATFVGYYRFQLAPLVILGVCDMPEAGWTWAPLRALDVHAGKKLVLTLLSAVGIAAATFYTCYGFWNMMASAERMRAALHEGVGDDRSVVVWPFGHVWVYADLGIEYPYAIPARYNASQDLWAQTAAADIAAQRWRFVVVTIDGADVEPGSAVTLDGCIYRVVSCSDNLAVLDGKGGEDALECAPYRIP